MSCWTWDATRVKKYSDAQSCVSASNYQLGRRSSPPSDLAVQVYFFAPLACAPRGMRLITHNLLSCHAACPGAPCTAPANFPLQFQDVSSIEIVESDLNVEFLQNMMYKIDYPALLNATRQVRPSVLARYTHWLNTVAAAGTRLPSGERPGCRHKQRTV